MSAGPFSSVPLVAVDRILQALLAEKPEIEPTTVPIDQAEGLVLAESLRVSDPVPPRSVALREGWAVDARASAGAGPYSPILSSSRPAFVRAGEYMPPDTDAVLPPEALTDIGPYAEIGEAVAPGQGVRRAGDDAAAGAELCPAGARLSALHIAAAREAGIAQCLLLRAHVGVVAPKDDGREAFLARFVSKRGPAVSSLPAAGGGWVQRLVASKASAFLVFGADPGDAIEALTAAGATILGRLAARPGEGTICALLEKKPVLLVGYGLGEAVAAAVLVLGPWLEIVAGAQRPLRQEGCLTRKLASGVGLTEIALVRILNRECEPLAVADLTLAALAQANAFVVVSPESEGWPAGAVVEAIEI